MYFFMDFFAYFLNTIYSAIGIYHNLGIYIVK
jgi:hypothetical protein